MSIVKYTLLFVCALFGFSGASIAEEELLKKSQVAAFIGSQKVLHSLSDEMKAAGVETFFKYDPKLIMKKKMPIFAGNISRLKKNTPAYYDRLTGIVTGYSHNTGVNNNPVYRFENAEDWAKIGDRIMLAYFTEHSTASRTGYDDLMSALPPGMMKMLNPEDRAKVEEQLGLLSSAQNVPEADKKLVDTFYDEIDDVLFEMH
ncbi:MAG: hypothetical protein COA45_00730 [Zetaproteobacteria bacterium]|nr:MAG: hypothetical protein COA45_00730 [Zetaproteobacteria bacterium]